MQQFFKNLQNLKFYIQTKLFFVGEKKIEFFISFKH